MSSFREPLAPGSAAGPPSLDPGYLALVDQVEQRVENRDRADKTWVLESQEQYQATCSSARLLE